MAALHALYQRLSSIYTVLAPPSTPTKPDALRLGILGAASIAPFAVIDPVRSHPDVIVSAVAARDRSRAEAYAKKHGIPHVFGSYQEMLDDEGVDVVYNPLPNGLHLEWTLKAIKAGKHVLLEKPSASNADETRQIFDAARKANVVVLEAFHYRFHPSLHQFAYLLHRVMSPINPLTGVRANLSAPFGPPVAGEKDIRYSYPLAGGTMMDMGVYPLSAGLYTMRVAGGTDKRAEWADGVEVREARPRYFQPTDKEVLEKKTHLDANGELAIDEAMTATVLVPTANPKKVPVEIHAEFNQHAFKLPVLGWRVPWWNLPTLSATFKDGSTVDFVGFPGPMLYHSLTITRRGRSAQDAGVPDGTKEHHKAYVPSEQSGSEEMKRAAKDGHWPKGTGEVWWSTYRYQLEAFVSGVRAAQAGTPAHEARGPVWVQPEESVTIMRVVDAIYDKAGLARRSAPQQAQASR